MTISIEEAKALAKRYKEDGVISTGARALIALADELKRLEEHIYDIDLEAKANGRD